MTKKNVLDLLLVLYLAALGLFIVAIPSHSAEETTFALSVPDQTAVVGVFGEFRTLEEEYQLLSKVYFKTGDFALPLMSGSYPLSIIEKVEFGPERIAGIPQKEGTLTVERTTYNKNVNVSYSYKQDVEIGERVLHLTWDYFNVDLVNGKPETEKMILEEPYLSKGFYMTGEFEGEEEWLKFASETYEALSAYLVDVALENGQSVKLYTRWQQPMAGSGPANLVYAEVDIQEGQVKQSNYWKLVYSASHHNWDERFWILFDKPLNGAYGIAVFRRNVFAEEPQQVYTLDANLQPLRQIAIQKITWGEIDAIPYPSSVMEWERY